MSGIVAFAQATEVNFTSATVVLRIKAPANQRVKVKEWGVFFDGTSSTAEPVQVILCKQTGTLAGETSITPVKRTPASETLQVTASRAGTGMSNTDILDVIECHPQGGYEKVFAPGDEIILAGNEYLAIECTAAAAVNVRPKIAWEE